MSCYNNVIGTGGSGGLETGPDGNQVGVANPGLAPLGNYGGTTQTMALLPGSPAIDAGRNASVTNPPFPGPPYTDQRGVARIIDGPVDIGAFESQGFTITVSSGDNQSTTVNTSFAAPLVVSVSSAFGEPVQGGVVTFTPPVIGASCTFPGGNNTAVIDSSGLASIVVAANAVVGGPYAVAAATNGAFGVSVNFNLTNQLATTTAVSSPLNPSTYGQSVTFTATVTDTSGSGGVPTGSVEFFDGSTDLGSGTPLTGSGTVATSTFTISTLSATTHSISADYTATGNFHGSTGMMSQIVAALQITGAFTAANKGYDGTNSATVLTRSLIGAISGDDVSLTGGTAAFSNKNAGIGKTVTLVGAALSGTAAGNYELDSVATTTADIIAAPLTVTAQPDSRGYDGTAASGVAPLVSGTLYDPIGTEPTQSYNNKNAGTGKTLTASGLVVNDDNGGLNYAITYVINTTGVINAAPLTITAVTNTKAFDGNTSAAATPTVSGLKGTDTVTNLSETYDTPAVGTGKTLSVATYTVNDGNGGYNYVVTTLPDHTGVIIPSFATQLVVHTPPPPSATAGQPFATQPVVYVEDAYGNLVTGDDTTQVTASLRVGTGPLLGTTTVTVSGGIATFTNLQDNKAENVLLLFTAPTLTKAQAGSTTVNPAAASRLSIAAPSTAIVGKPFSITVTAYDPYNNVATGYRGTVHFASTDRTAWLPANYNFGTFDHGSHTFGNAVTLKISGLQMITATDVVTRSITGSASVQVASTVTPAASSAAAAGASSVQLGKFRARRLHAVPAAAVQSPNHLATTVRSQTVTQADAILDRVLLGLNGKLLA